MSETANEQTGTEAQAASGATKLEDLLADLPDDARKAVLGEVTKARNEAKGLRARVREAEPALQRLASLEAAQQTEAERAQAALSEAQKRAEAAERNALRASVALRKGLPANLASRLQGDDEAALEADADDLLSMVPASTEPRAPRMDPSQGSSSAKPGGLEPRDQFAALMGGLVNQASSQH
jgi:hypothetical protein